MLLVPARPGALPVFFSALLTATLSLGLSRPAAAQAVSDPAALGSTQSSLPHGLSVEVSKLWHDMLTWQRRLDGSDSRRIGGLSNGWEVNVAYTFQKGWRAEAGLAPGHDLLLRYRLAETNWESDRGSGYHVWQVPLRLERYFALGLFSRFTLGPQVGLVLTRRQFHTPRMLSGGSYNHFLNEDYQYIWTFTPHGPAHRWQGSAGAVLAWHAERIEVRLVARYATPLSGGDVSRETFTYFSASRPQGVGYESRTRLTAWSAGLTVAYRPGWVIRPVLRNKFNEGGQQ